MPLNRFCLLTPWWLLRLAALADFVFMSKDYIREKLGFSGAPTFLQSIAAEKTQQPEKEFTGTKAFICAWGEAGVFYLELANSAGVEYIPANKRRQAPVIESIGAGDSFIGSAIAALASGLELSKALHLACEIATMKCFQRGFVFQEDLLVHWRRRLQQ